MVTSQNGWPASPDRGAIGVTEFMINGVSFPGGVKAGDVATVLGYVAEQIDLRVEELRDEWCWGHNYRPVAGSAVVSNHASGTAVDVNAPKHPRGARGTFTVHQRVAIRAILAEVQGVVRWGGDYTGIPDDMHFEINATPATVAIVAAALRTPRAKGKDMTTFYVRGSDRPNVYCVTTTGAGIDVRPVSAAEWAVVGKANNTLIWVPQDEMDAFLAETGAL